MDINEENKLKRAKIFIRFLKENHEFKYTMYAYNIVRGLEISNFDNFLKKINFFSPYMSMFDMCLTAVKLHLHYDYFYIKNCDLQKYFILNEKIT